MKKLNQLENIDKPREKILKQGVLNLKDYELLAIILGSGTKYKDVLKLSREIIKEFDKKFDDITLKDLLNINGLGIAKATKIIASIELSKRYILKKTRKIIKAKDIYDELQIYKNKKQEYFITITLDGANNIIEKRVVSIGIVNQTLVHPREVFADALIDRASSIIIAHNHPSGILEASIEDIKITKKLEESSKILGINLIDHIIISNNGYLSMKEENIF
jgi:DNA repair protein RadC